MRFLVLGATGMAGHTILYYLQEQGHDITAFSRRPISGCKNIVGNIRDLTMLKRDIEKRQYDCVINCIGALNQFAEKDKENAVFLNSYLPHYLVQCTANLPTRILHMSTDCVFSGGAGSYKEDAVPDGQSFYDRSKALGEVIDAKNLTFRNSIIGPDMHENGIGLFNWFMKQEGAINGYTKAIWTGVTTLTLAKAMEAAAQQRLTGVYQLVNNQVIDKYHLLLLFNEYFRANDIEVHPVDGVCLDKSLLNTRRDFDFVVPSYREMIRDMKNWVMQHESLYPHYKIRKDVEEK